MYVLLYVTASNAEEARTIGMEMVKRRLAACANVLEKIHSVYWWKGKIEEDSEALLILKSRKDKLRDIVKAVKKMHSYENPAVVALPILGGSEDFLEWIGEEVR
jgi:periplasmic divalent cation tolerance protein